MCQKKRKRRLTHTDQVRELLCHWNTFPGRGDVEDGDSKQVPCLFIAAYLIIFQRRKKENSTISNRFLLNTNSNRFYKTWIELWDIYDSTLHEIVDWQNDAVDQIHASKIKFHPKKEKHRTRKIQNAAHMVKQIQTEFCQTKNCKQHYESVDKGAIVISTLVVC